MAFRHVVLFRIHDDVAAEVVSAAVDELNCLRSLPGVLSLVVERSLDERKGRILIEEVTFRDASSFAAWRAHPSHLAAGRSLAGIADWWVGDYEV